MTNVTSRTKQQTWTILSLLDWSSRHLTEKGFGSPRLSVELLLSHVLRCQRIELYTNFDKPLSSAELRDYKSGFRRLLGHEPLQYILGMTEFMGLPFFVDRRVFIPRPETEILVEEVIKLSKKLVSSRQAILDVGTGSGNIAVSVAKFLPHVKIDAIDVSAEALEVAGLNAERNGVGENVNHIKCDFLSQSEMLYGRQYDIIVSNPPYVSQREFDLLPPEIKDFEPTVASTDSNDGLTFYKALSASCKKLLSGGGWIAVEMAYDQSEDVKEILRGQGYRNIETVLDYNRIQRVAKAQLV